MKNNILSWKTSIARKFAAISLLLLLLFGCTVNRIFAESITIVEDGKSDYKLVIPDYKDKTKISIMRETSRYMQEFIKKATGVELKILKESKFNGKTPAFYLGKTKAAEKAGLPLDKIVKNAWLKAVKGKNIFLVGNDSGGVNPKLKRRPIYGTFKAVTSFLEEEAGIKFLMSGPYGVYIPKLDYLKISSDIYKIDKPIFTYITGRRPYYLPYKVANNFTDSDVFFSYGGHSYYTAVAKEEYAETHPEYFALIGGVRSPSNNHLCVSNPEVQQLMIDEMSKKFDAGFQWVELAQTDGYVPCQCEKCNAISEDEGERLWKVHAKLARIMKKKYPDRKVMIISYGPTIEPPKTLKSLPDNVVVQMCRYTPEEFEEWEKFNVEKSVYVYNWGAYHVSGLGPKRNPKYAADQIRMFLDNKVKGIYLCGGFECMGLEGPVYYTYGKMLGDPSLNYENIVEDYYTYAFGKARAPMKTFFTTMYDSLSLFCYLMRPNVKSNPNYKRDFKTPEDWYCHFFPAKILIEMRKNLERAKDLAEDEYVKKRIKLVEFEFDYVENLATMFQLYRAYRLNPSWDTMDILAEKINERKNKLNDPEFFDKKRNRINQFDGWLRVLARSTKSEYLLGGRMTALLGAPVNWNTEILKENNILPGVGSKTAKIKTIDKINFDGRIDDACWQDKPRESLNEIAMGELKNTSYIKMGYDNNYMYFGIHCNLENIESLKHVVPQGRDGKVYQAECVELFLDPFGQRQKFYHFIFGPVANSFYDARVGFIDDVLDPLYNKPDKSWNEDWQYKSVIDWKNKYWTAEVRLPFKTLGVEKPSPGTTWTMNLGREEYPGYGGQRHGAPVLSLWSPNLENRSFGTPEAFGELVFE